MADSLNRLMAASPVERDEFARSFAERLGVDYDAIKRRRLFHLMTKPELAELDRGLVDIQLHTHRHIQPADQTCFRREIVDNRVALVDAGVSADSLEHYCYPNGETRPELPGWLRAENIRSATTCAPGLAEKAHEALLLPRFVDTQDVTPLKFEAWLSGAAALLPQRGRR
jgi:hypothetical protein